MGARTTAKGSSANALATFLSNRPWEFLTGSALKWIAIATMLVDHIGAVLVYGYYLNHGYPSDVFQTYLVLREIGRVAFPIFCFLLVEGFAHTHSRPKYALRLFIFALVSEVPYDFALHGSLFDLENQNVMFTLLIGLLSLWAAEELFKLIPKRSKAKSPIVETLIAIATLAVGCCAANLVHSSYEIYGVMLIGAFYLGRGSHAFQFLLGTAATLWYYMTYDNWLQLFAIIGVALVFLYNGKRGRGGNVLKYFFYVFYPAHLLILGLLAAWVI